MSRNLSDAIRVRDNAYNKYLIANRSARDCEVAKYRVRGTASYDKAYRNYIIAARISDAAYQEYISADRVVRSISDSE